MSNNQKIFFPGEKMLKAPTEANITEQMVLFGRFHQTFWLLVVPAHIGPHGSTTPSRGLTPQVARMPLHHRYLNVDPYLYVGGHEDWKAHPALANLSGFKGMERFIGILTVAIQRWVV